MKLSKSLGIVDQVRVALAPQYRLAAFIGALLGAVVPLSTFVVLHDELDTANPFDPRWLVVAGGLLYSATTVYRWGRLAFASAPKALGFTVLIEGVMTLATDTWLAIAALSYLVAMNAVATGVTLARGTAVDAKPPEPIAWTIDPEGMDKAERALVGREIVDVRTVAGDKREARRKRDRARRAAKRAPEASS